MKEKPYSIPITQSLISSYLKEVRKIKVMTHEREKELVRQVRAGNLTKREMDQIEEEMIYGNLRFVISIARQYQNQGVDFPDLVNEGNFGLVKAIRNFDWYQENRFISYAVWWIKQSILQCLNDNARTIRLPTNLVQELQKAKKEIDRKGGELDGKLANLPSMIELDMEVNEEGDSLFDIMKNENADMPDEVFNNKDIIKTKLIGLLTSLDERERAIIEDYYGISGTPRTLEDIGEDFDLTKERVRQIKQKALLKMRSNAQDLFEYF